MSYRDKNLEEHLLKMAYDDRSLSYVLKTKKEVEDYADSKHPEFMDEAIDYYLRVLGIIKEVHCDCCGREIQNVHHRGDLLIGSECINHVAKFPCSSPPASKEGHSSDVMRRMPVDPSSRS